MNKLVLIGLGVLAALAIGFFVYTRSSKIPVNDTKGVEQEINGEVGTSSSPDIVSVEQIVIAGDEFSFSPATVSLTKGQRYRIVYKNVGNAPHDLVIPDLKVQTAVIQGGQEVSVEVTPDKTGEFTFYCSVGNHRQQGMEGKTKVE